MLKPTYTKLDANGAALPADHPNEGANKHLAVRVEFPNWPPFIVSAYRCTEDEAPFSEVKEIAEKHDAYGWPWRAMTLEEAFFTADRTNPENRLDTNFFPDAEEWETTWTSDVDAACPSGGAWFVVLGSGDCYRSSQGYDYGVRAVCAGQLFGFSRSVAP